MAAFEAAVTAPVSTPPTAFVTAAGLLHYGAEADDGPCCLRVMATTAARTGLWGSSHRVAVADDAAAADDVHLAASGDVAAAESVVAAGAAGVTYALRSASVVGHAVAVHDDHGLRSQTAAVVQGDRGPKVARRHGMDAARRHHVGRGKAATSDHLGSVHSMGVA